MSVEDIVCYGMVQCTDISVWKSMVDDNITEGCSETHLYIGCLYVCFNMSRLIKYSNNIGQALETTVSKVALFSLQSVLASQILELLFPKVQNPTVYILCDIRSLCVILGAINTAAWHLGSLRLMLVAWRAWLEALFGSSQSLQANTEMVPKISSGPFFSPYILSDLSLIGNCDSLYTRNGYQMADSRSFCCFVAVWIRRIIIVATTRLTTIRVATTGEIIAPTWDVVVTVGEVVTGPRQQHTVTHDTLTWLLSMYCSGARVGAPICPGMGVVLAVCSSCTFNKRDPVNCVVPKKETQ